MSDHDSQSDARLLDAWRRVRDRDAMDRLIQRHIHFVYGAARRTLGEASGAEDVTQAVFMLLIQKCPRLPSDSALAVWLHRTTRFACANARKMHLRREAREQRVANERSTSTRITNDNDDIDNADERERLLPLLDEAITQLGERDRSGVILCYFQRRTFREIGAILGTTEEAARKRVRRSVDRMREYFASRGVATMSAAPIAAALGHESTLLAPPALVSATTKLATVSHIAALAHPSAQIAQKVMHTMLISKVKLATAACAAIITCSAVTATAIHQMTVQTAPTIVASSAVLAVAAPELFEAKVSDATLVQFAGVSKFGASADEWFTIDGKKTDDPRGPWASQPSLQTSKPATHQAMIVVTSNPPASTRIRIPKALAADSFVITPDAEHACWLVPFSVKPGTNSIDIDIMLAEGEWKTVVTAEHSQVGRPAGGYETEVGGIAFTHVSENPRNPQGSVVYVAHEVNDQQFDVLAVDSQGNEVGCDDVFSDKLGNFRTVRYEFGIAPDQIKAFVAKVRPYTKRVVAKDITLDPSKASKPTIEVSEIKQEATKEGK